MGLTPCNSLHFLLGAFTTFWGGDRVRTPSPKSGLLAGFETVNFLNFPENSTRNWREQLSLTINIDKKHHFHSKIIPLFFFKQFLRF